MLACGRDSVDGARMNAAVAENAQCTPPAQYATPPSQCCSPYNACFSSPLLSPPPMDMYHDPLSSPGQYGVPPGPCFSNVSSPTQSMSPNFVFNNQGQQQYPQHHLPAAENFKPISQNPHGGGVTGVRSFASYESYGYEQQTHAMQGGGMGYVEQQQHQQQQSGWIVQQDAPGQMQDALQPQQQYHHPQQQQQQQYHQHSASQPVGSPGFYNAQGQFNVSLSSTGNGLSSFNSALSNSQAPAPLCGMAGGGLAQMEDDDALLALSSPSIAPGSPVEDATSLSSNSPSAAELRECSDKWAQRNSQAQHNRAALPHPHALLHRDMSEIPVPAALKPKRVPLDAQAAGSPDSSQQPTPPAVMSPQSVASPVPSCKSPLSPCLSAPQTQKPPAFKAAPKLDFGPLRSMSSDMFSGLFEKTLRLGSGRHGNVWKVGMCSIEGETEEEREAAKQKPLAAKFLPRDDMGQDDVKLALSEIQLLQSIVHPNVVSIFDSFVIDTDLVMLLEYCERGDMASVLAYKMSTASQFTNHELMLLVTQVAMGVHHLHTVAHIAHNDLKPSNILLTKAGVVKIADFGVSSYAGPPDPPKRSKRRGSKASSGKGNVARRRASRIATSKSPVAKKMMLRSPCHRLAGSPHARSPAHAMWKKGQLRSPASGLRRLSNASSAGKRSRGGQDAQPPVYSKPESPADPPATAAPPIASRGDSPPKHKNMRPPQVMVGNETPEPTGGHSATSTPLLDDGQGPQLLDAPEDFEDASSCSDSDGADSSSNGSPPTADVKEPVRGTPLYWPPEVWLSVNAVAPLDEITNAPDCLLKCRGDYCKRKSDMWSLGVICFELSEQSRPFRGTTLSEVASNVLEKASGVGSRISKISNRAPQFVDLLLSLLVESPECRSGVDEIMKGAYLQRGLSVLLTAVRNSNIMPAFEKDRLAAEIDRLHEGAKWRRGVTASLAEEAALRQRLEEEGEDDGGVDPSELYPVTTRMREHSGVVQKLSSSKKWSTVALHLDSRSLWMRSVTTPSLTPLSPSRRSFMSAADPTPCMASPSASKGKPLPLAMVGRIVPDADPLLFALVVTSGKSFMFRATTAKEAEEWVRRLDLATNPP